MTSQSPIVILSGHRTGSSAVAGLLHLSGLHLGELLPPSPDNPRGYFEAKAVLQASREILARRTRDWTCPPQRFAPWTEDLDTVTQALSQVARDDRPWGFKDPRTLFLLPAWLQVLPEITFIGVRRSIEATARSISARDGIATDEATRIAALYDERLSQLHGALGFPIIEFGRDMAAVRTAVRQIVDQIDELSWDEEKTADFLDLALVHHADAESTPALSSELKVASIPASIVMRAYNALETTDREPARVHGPSYRSRLHSDWAAATVARPETGFVVDLVVTRRVQPPVFAPVDVPQITIEELNQAAIEESASHVIATDILEQIAPAELPEFLHALAQATDDDGVATVSGYIIDGAHIPARYALPDFATNTFKDKPPYFHHRSAVEAALLTSPWYLGTVKERPGGRTQLLLVKSAERRSPDAHMAHELRNDVYPQLQDDARESRTRIADLEREQRLLTRDLTVTRENLQKGLATLDKEKAQHEAMRRELDARREAEESATRALGLIKEQLGRVAAERDQAQSSNKKLQAQAATTRNQRDAARRDLRKLRSRRSVRMALGLAAAFRPFFRFVRGSRNRSPSGSTPNRPEKGARTEKDASAVADKIRRLRPEPGASAGPLVSIIVTTRNGRHHLERLLPGFESNTNYRSFELVVVDNGSTDQTAEYLAEARSFPVRVIRNQGNQSFSAANNQGIAAADGEIVLLLNNDIEPIAPGWLGAMVEDLTRTDDVGAVGALLVYSNRPESATEINFPPLTIQHKGIRFGWKNGHPWAMNLGGGEDPLDPGLTGSWAVPAATAACLMMRRSTLRDVGLLDEGYTYGSEDVDLCLRVREAGLEIRLCGDAALFHHEFGTQDTLAREVKRINRTGNERRFVETWSPRLRRSLQSDALSGGNSWGLKPRPTVGITLTQDDPDAGWGDWYTAHELGDSFEKAGWDVVYAERYKDRWYDLPEDLDLIISLLDSFDVRRAPRGAIKVAWVRNWLERWIGHPWFEHFDEIATSSSLAATEIAERTRYAPHLVPIATNPARFAPGSPEPTFESDFAFTGNFWGEGRSLIDQLLLRPDETFLLFGKGWDKVPRAQRYWRGQLDYERLPSVYRSAKIVLDDTASPTLPHGFLNSRVFDALASGTLVITDNEAGSEDIFGGDLPAYGSRAELRELMDTYRLDDELRHDLATRLRTTVVREHTYDKRATDFAEIAKQAVGRPRVAFKIGPPTWEEAPAWGDTHFATQFARALGSHGYATEIHVLAEWDDPAKQDADIVVHLRGLTPYVPKPAHYNIMWIISHPDDVSLEECERYDLVLVASESFAAELREQVSVPVHTMLQATDLTLFKSLESTTPESGPVIFVGNSRGEHRKAVRWAAEKSIPVEIYGGDWDELLGSGRSRGAVPNTELPALYRSAAILLNDHWDDMAEKGFVSNRIFDALACGAFVISDHVAGIEDLFGDIVPTYTTSDELAALVDQYATDPVARASLSQRGSELVGKKHSFAARAAQFVSLIAEPMSHRRAGVQIELATPTPGG